MKKKICLVCIILLIGATLFACAPKGGAVKESERLYSAQEELNGVEYLGISTVVEYDGKISRYVNGTLDYERSRAEVAVNSVTEYYFGGMRAEKTADGVELKEEFLFSDFTKTLTGTLMLFNYDEQNFETVTVDGNRAFYKFLGKGAKYSFNAAKDWTGGSYTVVYGGDGRAVRTVLVTSYKEGSVEHTVSAVSDYSYPTKLWDKAPTIKSQSTVIYGKYILTRLAEANEGKTLQTSIMNYGVGMEVFVGYNSQISEVSVVELSGGKKTAVIKYSGRTINIEALANASNVTKIEVTYNDDLVVSGVNVNKADNSYILK